MHDTQHGTDELTDFQSHILTVPGRGLHLPGPYGVVLGS